MERERREREIERERHERQMERERREREEQPPKVIKNLKVLKNYFLPGLRLLIVQKLIFYFQELQREKEIEDELRERKKQEKKTREKEAAYQERLRNWVIYF